MIARRSLGLVVALAVQGCLFRLGPTLSPAKAGCYAVSATGFTSDHARVTGFRALPDFMFLDTAATGRVLVPERWRAADVYGTNSARLEHYSSPFAVVADTPVVSHFKHNPPALPEDSLTVQLHGWSGSLLGLLARDAEGFSGSAFLFPRYEAKGVPSITLRLRRAPTCPGAMSAYSRRG